MLRYYYNNVTEETAWEPPPETRIHEVCARYSTCTFTDLARTCLILVFLQGDGVTLSRWIRCVDEGGTAYHFNVDTHESVWDENLDDNDAHEQNW